MSKLKFTLQAAALVVFTLAFTSLAQAQATRTWVSGVGDDVNPCSRTAPCKTWAGAISKTAAGGEIDALDPGGFGTLTITKSLIVDGTNGQGFGSTLNSGGINGFVINDSLSGTPNTAVVKLRNIAINGAGTTKGLNGIRFIAGKSLTIENVTIDNQTSHGIDVSLTAGAEQRVNVTNTVITECAGSGVRVNHSAGVVRVSLDRVVSQRNGNGATFENGLGAEIVNSRFSHNTTNGVHANSATGAASVNIDKSTINANANGVNTTGPVTVRISDCYIIGNTGNGVVSATSQVKTFGNNRIKANGLDVSGALGAIPAPVLQ